jgi:signal transduction histidine kinase
VIRDERNWAEFVADVGHDLKTFLNPVVGFSSVLIQDRKGLDPEQLHQLGLIQSSAHQLLERIDALVEFMRLEAGVMEAEQGWVSPQEVIGEVKSLLAEQADRLGVRIDAREIREPSRIRIDRKLLVRVLRELVANGLKASTGGSVSLGIQMLPGPEAHNLRFKVSDSGSGLDPESLSRLTRSLHPADRKEPERWAGLGLGLALARSAAERLGGEIEVAGNQGKGCTFTLLVDLPVASVEIG